MADYDIQYQDTYIDALLATANELKTAGYIYKGVATPSTNPGTPTERVAYLASEPGTYTNFGGIVIASGLYSLTYASGTWTGTQMSAGSVSASNVAYDNSQSVLASDNVQGALDEVSVGVRKTLITIPSTIHANGWMKFNGTFRSITGFDCRFTELIPCQEGDKFVWMGAGNGAYSEPTQVTSGENPVTWIFYDSNRSRVSSWSVTLSTQVVTIPSGVAFVQFTGLVKTTSATRPFIVGYNDVRLNVNDITKRMISSTIHANGWMKFNGTFRSITGFDCRFTELIPCQEGDKFVWMGAGNGAYSEPTQVTSGENPVTWIFYDSNRSRVSSWSVTLSTQVVTIPSGVAFVQFTGLVKTTSATRPFSVWKDDYIVSIAEGRWKGLKWVAFGDSLTEHNLRATKNYHDYINEWTGISVVNRGVSGSGYKYLYNESKAFYQRIQTQTDEDANVVTIFGSGNDLHLNNGVPIYPLGDVDDTGTETVCGCINATLDWLQANRPLMPLGIISMTPWRTNGGVPASNQDAYVDKLEQICKKRGVPYLDLYHCSNLHPDSSAFKNVAYKRDGTYSASSQGVTGAIQVTADNLSIVRAFGVSNARIGDWVLPNLTGVHPDEDGQKFFAPRIKAFLEELIEK